MQTNDTMNQEDRHIMTQIEKDLSEIKIALLGSPLSGDTGLVGRVHRFEEKVRNLDKKVDDRIKEADIRIEILEKSNVRNAVSMKIITWVAMGIGAGILSLIFKYFER